MLVKTRGYLIFNPLSSGSPVGYFKPRFLSVSRTTVAIIRLRWVLELAGTTVHGAHSVLVAPSSAP